MGPTFLLLGGLTLLTTASADAQRAAVCALTTAAVAGGLRASGDGVPGEMPIGEGPTTGETMQMCTWRMAAGGLHVSVARVPPGMTRAAALAELNKSYATLRAQGQVEEKREFRSVACYLMTPPAGQQAAPTTTSCLTIAKGATVSAATITQAWIPMEKIQTLVDSAAGRL